MKHIFLILSLFSVNVFGQTSLQFHENSVKIIDIIDNKKSFSTDEYVEVFKTLGVYTGVLYATKYDHDIRFKLDKKKRVYCTDDVTRELDLAKKLVQMVRANPALLQSDKQTLVFNLLSELSC